MASLEAEFEAALWLEKGLQASILMMRPAVTSLKDCAGGWIGGAGFATHVIALGLASHNNLSLIADDTLEVGLLTHCHPCALSGGMVVAATIALAVNEGENPEAIWHQLNIFMDGLPRALKVPAILRNKLDIVGRCIKAGIPTTEGIKQFESQPPLDWQNKTARFVIPGAIFAALNAPLFFRSLWEALEAGRVDNYKFWAIAGAIRGAMVGDQGLPPELVSALPQSEMIIDLADQLHSAITAPVDNQ